MIEQMNVKKYLENRLRGWLPKKPSLPHPQRKGSVSEDVRVSAKPDVTAISERRMQLSNGLALGLGIALILVGFAGWFSVNDTYRTLEKFFLAGGLDLNYYLFRDLNNQMAFYLTLMSYGAFALLFATLTLRSQTIRRIFYNEGPHRRLAGGLIGGGGTLALASINYLFRYILTPSYLELRDVQLTLFFIFFTVGTSLVICGSLALRGKKNVN